MQDLKRHWEEEEDIKEWYAFRKQILKADDPYDFLEKWAQHSGGYNNITHWITWGLSELYEWIGECGARAEELEDYELCGKMLIAFKEVERKIDLLIEQDDQDY